MLVFEDGLYFGAGDGEGKIGTVKNDNSLVERYEEIKFRYEELTAAITDKRAKSEIFGNFIKAIKNMNGMVETFDEGLWGGIVEYVNNNTTIINKKKVVFTFNAGFEITVC